MISLVFLIIKKIIFIIRVKGLAPLLHARYIPGLFSQLKYYLIHEK
jgi:hypothetical protein